MKRQRSRWPTRPIGSPTPRRSAASSRRSTERGPASAVPPSITRTSSLTTPTPSRASQASVVLLPARLVPEHAPDAAAGHDPAAVEALPPQPAGHHERDRRQIRVHEGAVGDLVGDGQLARRQPSRSSVAQAPPGSHNRACPPSPARAPGRVPSDIARRVQPRPGRSGASTSSAPASGTPRKSEPVCTSTGLSRSSHRLPETPRLTLR